MRIFAPNNVVAKSHFWYFIKKLRKVKKAAGEIVFVNEIQEKRPEQIKNFGIWLRYDFRSGTYNMYKEYRSLSCVGAVENCYQDMAARHRPCFGSIQIIRAISINFCVPEVAVTDIHCQYIKQLLTYKLSFPLPHYINQVEKKHHTLYQAKRPSTFY
ncbi:unnamed protein product [Cunninghamella echinulata]